MEALLTRSEIADDIVQKLMSGEMRLSHSSLSAFAQSPKTFIDYKLGIKEETDSMIYGSMVHCLVLEPDDFENRYFFINDADICAQIGGAKPRATKQYKEWYQYEIAGAGGRTIIDQDDYTHAKIVAENVRHNRASRKIMNQCPLHETKLEWEYKNFAFHGFKDGDGAEDIFDLKTCPDANPKKFQREIVDKGYHRQAAMYVYGGGKPKNYYIIAVDKKSGVSVHKLTDELLGYGMDEYDRIVTAFNECILTDAWDQSYDFWSSRYDGVFMAAKPNWVHSWKD